MCCDSWGHKESDTTEQLNWSEKSFNWGLQYHKLVVFQKVSVSLGIVDPLLFLVSLFQDLRGCHEGYRTPYFSQVPSFWRPFLSVYNTCWVDLESRWRSPRIRMRTEGSTSRGNGPAGFVCFKAAVIYLCLYTSGLCAFQVTRVVKNCLPILEMQEMQIGSLS